MLSFLFLMDSGSIQKEVKQQLVWKNITIKTLMVKGLQSIGHSRQFQEDIVVFN